MVNKIELTRIFAADTKSSIMEGLFKIYNEAINISEQKPRMLLEKMLKDSNYYFYVSVVNEQVIGFAILYSPINSDYCLLEYIAVDDSLRGQGYGGKIFDALTEIFSSRSMVIEIDSPFEDSEDSAIRLKRIEFYKSHGSRLVQGLNYILPMGGLHTPEMLILLHSNIYNESIPKEKLSSWLTDIYVSVYGCGAGDERLSSMLCDLPDDIILRTASKNF